MPRKTGLAFGRSLQARAHLIAGRTVQNAAGNFLRLEGVPAVAHLSGFKAAILWLDASLLSLKHLCAPLQACHRQPQLSLALLPHHSSCQLPVCALDRNNLLGQTLFLLCSSGLWFCCRNRLLRTAIFSPGTATPGRFPCYDRPGIAGRIHCAWLVSQTAVR